MERMITIENEITSILSNCFCLSSGFLLLLFFLVDLIFFINTVASSAYFTTFGYQNIVPNHIDWIVLYFLG